MEYSFYSVISDNLPVTVARLSEKVYLSGERATVFAEEVDLFDKTLWTFSTAAFIPHGTERLGYPEKQAVWLTTVPENKNGSSVLILINHFEYQAWDGLGFSKILFMFSEQLEQDAINSFKLLQKADGSVNYWNQTAKGWVKKF